MEGLKYEVIFKPRKRSITISVSRQNQITVSAPAGIPQKMIEEVLRRQDAWIAKRIRINRELEKKFPKKTYQAGEKFHFLGTDYPLEISDANRREISLAEGKLKVSLNFSEEKEISEVISEMIQAWYEATAHSFLRERVAVYEKRMNLKAASLEIQTVGSFWGSCRRSGKLKFNAKLMMAPADVVDYVVVHELCHMLHPNHSRRFWQAVEKVLPDYRACRGWLNRHGQYLSF